MTQGVFTSRRRVYIESLVLAVDDLALNKVEAYMGRHIIKWTKLNFVARHYDPFVKGNNGHNGMRQNSTWPISICGDPYEY